MYPPQFLSSSVCAFLALLPTNGNVKTYNSTAEIKQITNKFILDMSPFFFVPKLAGYAVIDSNDGYLAVS